MRYAANFLIERQAGPVYDGRVSPSKTQEFSYLKDTMRADS